jgi:hypothetical protein
MGGLSFRRKGLIKEYLEVDDDDDDDDDLNKRGYK